jgi:MFS family permease
MPAYVTETLPHARGASRAEEAAAAHTSQLVQVAVMVVALICIPLLGMLSDRIGRKPIAWFGAVGLVVLAFPMIALIRAQGAVSIFLGLMIVGFPAVSRWPSCSNPTADGCGARRRPPCPVRRPRGSSPARDGRSDRSPIGIASPILTP